MIDSNGLARHLSYSEGSGGGGGEFAGGALTGSSGAGPGAIEVPRAARNEERYDFGGRWFALERAQALGIGVEAREDRFAQSGGVRGCGDGDQRVVVKHLLDLAAGQGHHSQSAQQGLESEITARPTGLQDHQDVESGEQAGGIALCGSEDGGTKEAALMGHIVMWAVVGIGTNDDKLDVGHAA